MSVYFESLYHPCMHINISFSFSASIKSACAMIHVHIHANSVYMSRHAVHMSDQFYHVLYIYFQESICAVLRTHSTGHHPEVGRTVISTSRDKVSWWLAPIAVGAAGLAIVGALLSK